jgi:ornithine carbamoyltransferase
MAKKSESNMPKNAVLSAPANGLKLAHGNASLRHFIELTDWTGADIENLLKDALRMKKDALKGKHKAVLQGRVLGMIFEKPSLRTRVSFQAAMAHLGGQSIFLTQQEVGFGVRESLPDVARTISQFVDVLALRVFEHRTVEEFAKWATVPVINALSDEAHPCQALGDLLTIREHFGDLAGRTLTFVGDGNNVARSLALACGKVGIRFILSAPEGYRFDDSFREQFAEAADANLLSEISEPKEAVHQADVIYTDVWTSMGQESETAERLQRFKNYCVDGPLMAAASKEAIFMHCLPAHRGEETTEEVMESPQSLVFEQAGNRLHAQKALLRWIFDA